jgi:NAD(P)-dependent dehydrogenase (short-subunit alcohol dehydrogenase family)
MDARGLEGRNAVVTGAGSGIGRATATRLRDLGAHVASVDLRDVPYVCDVTDPEQVRSTVDRIAGDFGPIHVLFNNAGVAVRHTVVEETPEEWDRCLRVNVRSTYLVAKHVIPHMPSGGSIVNNASVTGIAGIRNRAAYSASKGAIVALTRNMALDYAGRGIRVNCVCPGFVRTPLIARLLADEQRTERLTALHPLGRLGEPEDIANAVAFLASREAAWITGVALPVDGGFSAGHAVDV